MKRAGWDSSSVTPRGSFVRTGIAAHSVLLMRCLALMALLGLALPTKATAPDPILQLNSAEFILSDADQPPPDSAPWKPQLLPDAWRRSRPGTYGYAWYRLRFDVPHQPTEPFAIYTSVLRTVGVVYVNGILAGRSAPFDKPELSRRPHFFIISPSLVHPGTNTLHLQLYVKQGWPGLVPTVEAGDETLLRPEYEWRMLLQPTGPQIICVFSITFGLFMLLLWLRRRRESAYGYFGLSMLFFAVYASLYFVRYPLMPAHLWFSLIDSASMGVVVTICLFALRYVGWHWPRTEACLWACLVASPFLFFCRDIDVGGWLPANWYSMFHLVYLLYTGILIAAAWRRRTLDTVLLSIATIISYVGVVWGNYMQGAEDRWPSLLLYFYLPQYLVMPSVLPYSFLPLYLVIAWILVGRFVRSLTEYEALNAELEQRVTQKHTELEQNYQRIQQMERQQAVVEERQRIMSDMHDGIGGQLISTLSLVEHGEASSTEVAAALRECVDDLRLTIDSLEPTENDLLPILGNLRYRLDGRLKKQGINLDWRVKEVPKLSCLNPRNVLHILRILQEAFTNVLKHAHASMIRVETGVDALGKHVFIRVSDNGNGFAGEHTGRGLENMRRRAHIIGGELDIRPSPTGTTLNLSLPVA